MSLSEFFRKLNNHIGTHKVHLCPEVKGCLLNAGEPLSNVKITRLLSYSDGKYIEDSCYTDSNGQFFMSEKSLRSSQPALLIAEKIVHQYITAIFNGKEHKLWSSSPSGISIKIEYQDKLKNLICDVADCEVSFYFLSYTDSGKYRASGICRWESDFIIIDAEAEFARMCQGMKEDI